MEYPKVPQGCPIPPKVFTAAVEEMREYSRIGEQWVNAGRPRDCEIYTRFCESEKRYNERADQIWFGAWTPEQRQYWSDVFNR